jgi:peptide chain release factor 2
VDQAARRDHGVDALGPRRDAPGSSGEVRRRDARVIIRVPIFSRPCPWNSLLFASVSPTSPSGSTRSGGIFDFDTKVERLEEVTRELESPDVWNKPEHAQQLGRERAALEKVVNGIRANSDGLKDARELLELAEMDDDQDTANSVVADVEAINARVEKLEFQRMFSGDHDPSNAFVDIQAGAGGTEAQDWAEMMLRMYLRWCEHRGWKTELMEVSAGEVAGIKSATLKVEGDYAYGWLKTEIGVHRLVRKSPFDSDNRRHTSFTSVFVSPEVDDDIDIEINPADLRTDVYRSSGAGGQHVNKTESAVRITHIPTNTVVACQTGRSQHQNRDNAMKMLKAKLYELELLKRNAEKDALEATKSDIGWGSQIRNYVLDQSRIKDLRTGIERTDTQKVLDGDLDEFIEASLKAGLESGAKRSDAA